MDKSANKTIAMLDHNIDDALAALQCYADHANPDFLRVARNRLSQSIKLIQINHPALRHYPRNADHE